MTTGASFVIKPNTERHRTILTALRNRFRLSERHMEQRHKKWRDAEEQFIAFLPERDIDAHRRSIREGGKPQYTTIVVPFTYAVLMTAHTYWTTVFLSRNPVFQFAARHGETKMNVQAVESLIEYQMTVGEMLVPLYIWLMDAGKYGIGILGNFWEDEQITVSQIVEQQETIFNLIPTGNTKKVKQTRTVQGYQGNKLFNVRPYYWFPDPRVPLHRFQEGEFCFNYTEVGWNTILKRAEAGDYFNIEELRKLGNTQSSRQEDGTNQLDRPGEEGVFIGDDDLKNADFQPLYECAVELVPKHWKLGGSGVPEKWVFTVSKDFDLIIGARPLGSIHNKYPYVVNIMEPEGYSMNVRGMPEVMLPMQNTMDWLVNTHFYNVRKALNDQFVVDPSRVAMKDVLDPEPGGVWRLKPAAYGSDVRTVVTQLPVVDVTIGHMKDTQFIWEMTQRIVGVTDNLMGVQNPGGRKTATEVRTSGAAGINRLKTNAEYYSALGWAPLAQMMLQNSQQFYDLEKKFKIAGDLMVAAGETPETMTISPEEIQGFYDFLPVDGTLPIDRFAQANLWKELLLAMQRLPQIGARYDIAGIFSWVAQLSGLKNVNQFKIQIAPDNSVQQGVDAGNLVSLQGVNNAVTRGGGGPAGEGGGETNLSEPGQVPSVGPTG